MHSNELRTIAEEEVSEVIRQLPEKLRAVVSRVIISYEPAPTTSDIEEGLIGDELGLFQGPSLIDDPGIEEMPQIRLFLANVWDWVDGDLPAFREEVATTFLHELGHFLGWDEDEIAERGLD
ncbi:MAG: metallopeptidase family protein [Luteolibacter sp.]|jgi:predicted Zn-dependent protease with MMP-like domain